MRRRLVFLLVDGMGDVSLPQLHNMTPLQTADTPFFDAVAESGVMGLMDSVETGLACGSDTSHLAIFGYDPRLTYRGRGAFESLGAGCSMDPGDIAFKSNLATIDDASNIVKQRRVDRSFEKEGPVLCEFLNGTPLLEYPGHSVEVKYATEHRCGVVLHGPGLSDAISGTDPLKDNRPLVACTPTDDSEEAKWTAGLVNYVSACFREKLKDHPINKARVAECKAPANVVLLRGCGVRLKVPSFQEKHGMSACIVAPTKVLGGLGLTLGMEWIQVPGTTGSYDSQFHRKGAAICEAVTDGGFDFGFVHVKAVDDTGHDRLWQLRVRYLELMDRLLAQIIKRLHVAEQKDPSVSFCVLVTADHSTPVTFGDHSIEPVPLAMAHVSDVVTHLGAAALDVVELGPLPALTQHSPVDDAELQEQAQKAAERRRERQNEQGDGVRMEASAPDKTDGARGGDPVVFFDEISAARGALGRFPSSELMPLVQQVLSV